MSRCRGLIVLATLCAPLPACAQQTRVPEPARVLVLVLAPGASLSDWQRPDTPVLRRLTQTAPLAVVPTRAGSNTRLAPYHVLATGTRSPSEERLGATLRAGGIQTVALGGEAASIVAGTTNKNETTPWRMRRAEAPQGWATDVNALARAVQTAQRGANASRLFVAVQFDDITRADDYARFAQPRATAEQRRNALRQLDHLLGKLTALGSGTSILLVTPEPSASAARRGERLGPLLLWHGDSAVAANTLLTSPSTRRTPGLVASTDLATTIATLLGVPREQRQLGAGRAIEVADAPGDQASAAFLAGRVVHWAAQAREQRLLVGVPWVLAGALLAAAGLTLRPGVDRRTLRVARALAVWVTCVPAALLLASLAAPEAPRFFWVVYAIAFVLSSLPALSALRFAAHRVLIGVCGATTLLLLADGLNGGWLLSRSPFSFSVIEAARFYGVGNEAAGAWVGAALVAASRAPAWGAATTGVVVGLALGLPVLGADFGGLVTALVGFAVLISGRFGRATLGRVVLGAALGALALGVLVAWEATRTDLLQTHVGQAVASAKARGMGALAEIIARKATMNGRLLVSSPWAVLLLAEVGAGLWRWLRARDRTAIPLPSGLGHLCVVRAVVWAGATALLVNDSGVVAAATCLLYGVALWTIALGDPDGRLEAHADR